MKNVILRLQIFRIFSSLVKDPTQTEKIFSLSEKSRRLPSQLIRPTIDFIFGLPGFRGLYDNRYDPPIPGLKELLSMPEGSLGHALGSHLKSNNLTIEFFPVVEGYDEIDYILRRVRRTHDYWHVLTGFDTSVAGEAGLQAFTYAQLRAPFSALLIAISILHSLDGGQEAFFDVMKRIFEGYQAGIKSKPLIVLRLEERNREDLKKFRLELGLADSSLI